MNAQAQDNDTHPPIRLDVATATSGDIRHALRAGWGDFSRATGAQPLFRHRLCAVWRLHARRPGDDQSVVAGDGRRSRFSARCAVSGSRALRNVAADDAIRTIHRERYLSRHLPAAAARIRLDGVCRIVRVLDLGPIRSGCCLPLSCKDNPFRPFRNSPQFSLRPARGLRS